jgi:hypothetical protein
LQALSQHKIKSKVQTYDIRDCEEYYGILELEALLKKSMKDPRFTMELADIRRSSSKQYIPG